jgi:23S rRNA (pseudouridine1915-N3)-methyltransferase
VFVIGGAYGSGPELFAKASYTLSLSPMTLPHELARLFFTEQLYRALCIRAGHPYHHI